MKTNRTWIVLIGALSGLFLFAQKDFNGHIVDGARPVIAVPNFRGVADAQNQMETFNRVLWDELKGSGVLNMAPQSFYPLNVPQQPQDFKPPANAAAVGSGWWLTDWSSPPVGANYLASGYTAVQNERLILRGWLYQTAQPDLNTAQALRGKMYFGSPDAGGAKKVAREYAADILQYMGVPSLLGTKIYFVSDRTGNKEIWSMDDDGSNQRPVTNLKSTSLTPAVSPDGKLVAFTTYARGNPQIAIQSLETSRPIPFRNPAASLVTTPEFAADGQHLLFSATVNPAENDGDSQLCISKLDGTGIEQISHARSIEVSPRVNGKTGRDVVFISHRAGSPQLWRMNIGGGDVEMLTDGMGEVSNPAWSPNGQTVAFAWTRGYELGNFNIFVMDIATREPVQITRDSGVNENPSWAPDGRHIVFASKRSGTSQIYTMLADGTDVRLLTKAGNNSQPVWAKGIQ